MKKFSFHNTNGGILSTFPDKDMLLISYIDCGDLHSLLPKAYLVDKLLDSFHAWRHSNLRPLVMLPLGSPRGDLIMPIERDCLLHSLALEDAATLLLCLEDGIRKEKFSLAESRIIPHLHLMFTGDVRRTL